MDRLKRRITGYSSANSIGAQTTLHDKDIAKQDLINAFYTRRGERVMLPDFGCIIWEKLMEPFTSGLKDLIVYDAKRIVESDPRFTLVDISVTELTHGLLIEMVLEYTPENIIERFVIEFDKRMAERR